MLYKNALCVYPHQQGAPEKKYCPPIGLEYLATVLEGLVAKVTLTGSRLKKFEEERNEDGTDTRNSFGNRSKQWNRTGNGHQAGQSRLSSVCLSQAKGAVN
jgi:hypothetical protein